MYPPGALSGSFAHLTRAIAGIGFTACIYIFTVEDIGFTLTVLETIKYSDFHW